MKSIIFLRHLIETEEIMFTETETKVSIIILTV